MYIIYKSGLYNYTNLNEILNLNIFIIKINLHFD